jgi:carbon storage regulator
MLVLSRRIDEAIIIGDNVRIEIVDVCGGRVRLAIEAPRHVSVDRDEVWRAKRAERLRCQESSYVPVLSSD